MEHIQHGQQDHDSKGRTPAQATVIALVKGLSVDIAESHPEIVDDYRTGLTQSQIVEKYSFDAGNNPDIARNAVREALKRLMGADEMKRLAKKRMVENGQRAGVNSLSKRLGIYNATPEERKQRSSDAGKAALATQAGIFALTPAERVQSSRHANSCMPIEEKRAAMRKALLKVGKVPWDNTLVDPITRLGEVDYLYKIAEDPEYIIQGGARKGCRDNIKIAARLNEVFHGGKKIRTASAVNTKLSRRRTQKRNG